MGYTTAGTQGDRDAGFRIRLGKNTRYHNQGTSMSAVDHTPLPCAGHKPHISGKVLGSRIRGHLRRITGVRTDPREPLPWPLRPPRWDTTLRFRRTPTACRSGFPRHRHWQPSISGGSKRSNSTSGGLVAREPQHASFIFRQQQTAKSRDSCFKKASGC